MGFFSFLGGGSNPAKYAQPYLQEVPKYGVEAYDQYKRTGRGAEDILGGNARDYLSGGQVGGFGAYGQMATDPLSYLRNIEGAYQPSAGYQYRKGQLLKDAGNTAAAGGYAGTEEDIASRTALVNALMSGDMQQFLSNITGIQGAGLSGKERLHDMGNQLLESQAGRGFQASGSLADYLGGNLGAQSGLAYQGQANKNANQNALINALMQAGAMGAGAYYGAGAGGGNQGYNPLGGNSSSLFGGF